MVYIVQNKEDFDSQLKAAGDKLVVVDFFANWCGPCKMISPKLEELANQYADKVVVLKVDVDDCDDLDLKYGVSSMPTFIFIKNCEKIDCFVGANKDKLEQFFLKYVESS